MNVQFVEEILKKMNGDIATLRKKLKVQVKKNTLAKGIEEYESNKSNKWRRGWRRYLRKKKK